MPKVRKRTKTFKNKRKKGHRPKPSKKAQARKSRLKHDSCLRKIFRSELNKFTLHRRPPGKPRLWIDDPRCRTLVHSFLRRMSKFMGITKSRLRNLLYRKHGILPMEVRRLFLRLLARRCLIALPRKYLRKRGKPPRLSPNRAWGLLGPWRAVRRVLDKVGIKPPKLRKGGLRMEDLLGDCPSDDSIILCCSDAETIISDWSSDSTY